MTNYDKIDYAENRSQNQSFSSRFQTGQDQNEGGDDGHDHRTGAISFLGLINGFHLPDFFDPLKCFW